jgi:leucyl aminopeptidase
VVTLRRIAVVSDAPAAAQARFVRLAAVAAGAAFARNLVVAPANRLTPRSFVTELARLQSRGIALEFIDPASAGLNLLAAVGKGSAYAPRLAVLRWNGAPKSDRPVAFVGKGITFDTGGIGIKESEDLDAMKGDMAGAAAVAGTLYVLAARRAPVNAVGVLAIAENMLSGNAMRPGDVVRAYNGTTVEIVDTDAEGRLVLADALAYTATVCRPRWIIDLATLTGAVEVTLGNHRAGLFTADDRLASMLIAAGEAEDELMWRLPLTDLYDDALKSEIADLRNCTWERGPDALHAARFLQNFIPPGVAWAHIDIAGLSESVEDEPLAAEGPKGFGVRLLDRLVADQFEG